MGCETPPRFRVKSAYPIVFNVDFANEQQARRVSRDHKQLTVSSKFIHEQCTHVFQHGQFWHCPCLIDYSEYGFSVQCFMLLDYKMYAVPNF